MAKLDKKAHAKALSLHEKLLRENPDYKAQWDRLLAQLFTDLAETKIPDDQ
ncbi:hypothetical protein [Bradyrhizobium sp. CCH5-F6]|jgi:hypothetical protein|uniref:hypothetical protein n=1 Tax=Bradyrhizobium sp. CCH5-F6 TaxID=1768753 RepID=UPI000ABD8268|nr:hypothetical protein [Bradyrhizobium sp. CCH5-F6]